MRFDHFGRPRWGRFSLRALVAVTLLAGVSAGWLGSAANERRREQALISEVNAALVQGRGQPQQATQKPIYLQLM